jgi:hypothetical protein
MGFRRPVKICLSAFLRLQRSPSIGGRRWERALQAWVVEEEDSPRIKDLTIARQCGNGQGGLPRPLVTLSAVVLLLHPLSLPPRKPSQPAPQKLQFNEISEWVNPLVQAGQT